MRHRDIHLLTVGRYTYTSDQRFEALHLEFSDEWTLRIRYPQAKDSGIYECQISTTPPIGHKVYLTVVGEYFGRTSFYSQVSRWLSDCSVDDNLPNAVLLLHLFWLLTSRVTLFYVRVFTLEVASR